MTELQKDIMKLNNMFIDAVNADVEGEELKDFKKKLYGKILGSDVVTLNLLIVATRVILGLNKEHMLRFDIIGVVQDLRYIPERYVLEAIDQLIATKYFKRYKDRYRDTLIADLNQFKQPTKSNNKNNYPEPKQLNLFDNQNKSSKIQYISGNLLNSEAEAIILPVNYTCLPNNMGIINDAQIKFPISMGDYLSYVKTFNINKDDLHNFIEHGKIIIHFPTKGAGCPSMENIIEKT